MNTPVGDEEFTALVDADIPRVDLVDKAANGTRFLIAKQADGAGLLSADLVRDLIGKSQPEPAPEETVTMSGPPGALMKMIHEAAVRREAAELAKAEMSTAKANDLPDSDFAYIEAGGTKDDEGKTTPRSLRHFPINDAAHVRNALSRAPQSPFGDKAMPKIRAAAKKFGIEVAKMIGGDMDDGVDGMDPTVVLAAPDGDDAPGDPADPGSPAWEAIDAATAQKWTSIAVRLKNALGVMADREMLEAATADPDDAENAWDLQDAQCALDYVIDTLAGFAVDEQAEAELCTEAMEQVGKALGGFDPAPLDTFEALAPVAKAGRSLSAANEQAIRDAVSSLQKVLASLPAAPVEKESGRAVAKTANEEPDMPEPTTAEETVQASGQEPAMGTQEPMAKADGDKPKMVAVYDQNGNLVGVVDPTEITVIEGAGSNDDSPGDDTSDASDADASDDSGSDDTQTTDLDPQPAAEAGTPADAVDDGVTKSTNDTDMFKSIAKDEATAALDAYSATQEQVIAKQASDLAQLADTVEKLTGLVKALEEQPAAPRVFTNGAVPPAHQLRGQDRGTPALDNNRAQELKKGLYGGVDAAEQNRIHNTMQAEAIAALQAIHRA